MLPAVCTSVTTAQPAPCGAIMFQNIFLYLDQRWPGCVAASAGHNKQHCSPPHQCTTHHYCLDTEHTLTTSYTLSRLHGIQQLHPAGCMPSAAKANTPHAPLRSQASKDNPKYCAPNLKQCTTAYSCIEKAPQVLLSSTCALSAQLWATGTQTLRINTAYATFPPENHGTCVHLI